MKLLLYVKILLIVLFISSSDAKLRRKRSSQFDKKEMEELIKEIQKEDFKKQSRNDTNLINPKYERYVVKQLYEEDKIYFIENTYEEKEENLLQDNALFKELLIGMLAPFTDYFETHSNQSFFAEMEKNDECRVDKLKGDYLREKTKYMKQLSKFKKEFLKYYSQIDKDNLTATIEKCNKRMKYVSETITSKDEYKRKIDINHREYIEQLSQSIGRRNDNYKMLSNSFYGNANQNYIDNIIKEQKEIAELKRTISVYEWKTSPEQIKKMKKEQNELNDELIMNAKCIDNINHYNFEYLISTIKKLSYITYFFRDVIDCASNVPGLEKELEEIREKMIFAITYIPKKVERYTTIKVNQLILKSLSRGRGFYLYGKMIQNLSKSIQLNDEQKLKMNLYGKSLGYGFRLMIELRKKEDVHVKEQSAEERAKQIMEQNINNI